LLLSNYIPSDPRKLHADFQSLNLYDTDERVEAITMAFTEVNADHYVGFHPPQKGFESSIRNLELLEFAWPSHFFRTEMYLKFCIRRLDKQHEDLYLCSLHRNNPEKRKQGVRK